jgi:hypothetical protein
MPASTLTQWNLDQILCSLLAKGIYKMIFDMALCRPEHKSKVGESLNRSGAGQFEVVKLHLETMCV